MNKTIRNQQTVEEMINFIAKENTLHQVLRDNKIAEIDKIYQINPYERDGGRRGLIIDVQEKNADARSKIMIDLKQGQPIINQVYDSLYDIGKDCSKRIIMYSNGRNELDKDVPAADYWPVNCLINNLRQYPLGFHFLEMNQGTFNIGPHYMHEYFEPENEYSLSEVPTKEQFMAETFWIVYFDSFSGCFYESHKTFSDRFRNTDDWGHIIYIDCSFYGEIKLYWDHKGVRYVVKQETDYHEYLKMVLDYEMPVLQERYGSDTVNFENVVGKLPRLYIKYSDRPFDWIYTATPRQITEFAKAMHEDAWALRWRIEERIDGLMKKESA